MEVRNVAIIAHVDHGKTTLVDRLLQQTVIADHVQLQERALDSNDLERERGITILAKTTAIEYKNTRINIVDTPGHTDFGGEVERVLKMVDSVLLVVDAVDGPMPQTRYVTSKAFSVGLKPIVVINKVDLPAARPEQVVEEVFDLFDDLGATEEQMDFEVAYTSAVNGTSGVEFDDMKPDMGSLLDLILTTVPHPEHRPGPFQMQVCTLDYSSYTGIIGIGRIQRGSVRPRDRVTVVANDGSKRNARVSTLQASRGLDYVDLEVANAGDIVCISGIQEVQVSETLCDPDHVEPLPVLEVDEPTVTMQFKVNTSPVAGTEGQFLTSRHLSERLFTEASHNVALRVTKSSEPDTFQVSGRGELHLSILIETMRREGYELAVSQPVVIYKNEGERLLEPFDEVSIDVDGAYQGAVIELMGKRKAQMKNLEHDSNGRVQLDFEVATRGLLGINAALSTASSGTSVLTYGKAGYRPKIEGLDVHRRAGVLVANAPGKAVGYALFNLQNRGKLFIDPGTDVYAGMIIGQHSRDNDLLVNPMKEKKLTNIRAAGSDENIILTPPVRFSLEQALAFINDDELVEVTPSAVRLRKKQMPTH